MSGGLMSGGRMSGGRLSGGLKSYDPVVYTIIIILECSLLGTPALGH